MMRTRHIGPLSCRQVAMVLAAAAVWLLPLIAVAQTTRSVSRDAVLQMVQEVSNWGRWGDDDQLGALNLITPAKRKQAAELVHAGISVSLARNVETEKTSDNPFPFVHQMLATGADPSNQWAMDNFSVSYHGYAHTHMDALCHLFHDGKMYNGFAQTLVTDDGAGKLSIHNLKQGILTRGILMDIPRLRGVEYLEPGTPIYTEDLEAWETRAGMQVQPGDVVFIRTGRWARRDKLGPWSAEDVGAAGLHVSCCRWLRARDIAMLGSDAASDVLPSGVPSVSHPVHLLTLYAMGVHIFDNCDLEALSQQAAQLNRWVFMISAAPLPVVGGTGSPLNPIATF